MSKLCINGGRRLCGELTVQGAKNSVLPLLAAAVLCDGESVIHNCPDLSDVSATVQILRHLGCSCKREDNTLIVNAKNLNRYDIPDILMREMRSSIVLLGALVGRTGKAVLSSPGGCEIGPRPIDLHISALKQMGISIEENHGFLDCSCPRGLFGANIHLSFPSVGATENIILAATKALGKTVIHNAAREPEIIDLQNFINESGGCVSGAGSDKIEIHGVKKLFGTEHTVIPDRIVAATYMGAAAITGGEISLKNTVPSHMVAVCNEFSVMGCSIAETGDTLYLKAPKRLNRFPAVKTMVYPGFPTDAGPIVAALACLANGTSVFVENIFESRFKYIDELRRLGAKATVAERVAVIEGVDSLSGAVVKSTDLRGGAALVLAALAANGHTTVEKTCYIDRGYECIEENLRYLGADIKRV